MNTLLQEKVPLRAKRELGALIFLFHYSYQKAQSVLGMNVSERIVEHAWLLKQLSRLRGRLLDAGGCFSYLSHYLVMKGFDVWVLDGIAFPQFHPSSAFVRGDMSQLPIRDGTFDVITSVSTIEHVGTGEFGVRSDKASDLQAMAELLRILRPQGSLFITVPYGFDRGQATHRFYDDSGLASLGKGLELKEIKYGIRRGSRWFIEKESPVLMRSTRAVNAVAMLHLVKP